MPNVLPPAGGVFSGTTSGPSLESGTCGANTAAASDSVFTWTPAVTGTAIIETCSATLTAFDTVLYARSVCANPASELSCNADTIGCATATGPSVGSRLSLPVTAGTPVFIVVDGENAAASGNFQLRVIPPAGLCAAPNVIPATGGTFVGRTSGGGAQAGSCQAGTSLAGENVYSWTPTGSGTATITTCGATSTAFNTVLHARATPCSGGAELACNDNTVACDTFSGAGQGSSISVPYTAGNTVFIVVDGAAAGQVGDYLLTVTP